MSFSQVAMGVNVLSCNLRLLTFGTLQVNVPSGSSAVALEALDLTLARQEIAINAQTNSTVKKCRLLSADGGITSRLQVAIRFKQFLNGSFQTNVACFGRWSAPLQKNRQLPASRQCWRCRQPQYQRRPLPFI